MTDFEKVEKLRERANVTYEEAKAALDEANGDILEAMIILENQGKTAKPNNASYSTKHEEDANLPVLVEGEQNKKSKNHDKMNEFGRKVKALMHKLVVNYLVIERKEEEIIKVPLWLFLVIVLLGIHVVPILIVISLFFGFRYFFIGEDEMKMANDVAQKAEKVAGDVVDVIKDEYNKL